MSDSLFERAKVFTEGLDKVSVSVLQRQFRIGYMTASRLLDELAAQNLVKQDETEKWKYKVVKTGVKTTVKTELEGV